MPKKSAEHDFAKEYVAAIAANDHRKAQAVFEKIDANNRSGHGTPVIHVSKRKVNAALKEAKGDKAFLRQYIDKPGSHKTILKGGCWGMTRRRRGTRRSTRKNGFFGL